MVCGGLGNALGTGKETLLMKIGFWELIVIVIVAFVFVGPDQLPEIAKSAVADACTGSNPRQPSQEEMEKLLKCCYYDTEVDF